MSLQNCFRSKRQTNLGLPFSAQLYQVWIKYQNAENKHRTLQHQFEEYVKYYKLPVSLREAVSSYFHFKFHKNFFKESDIEMTTSPYTRQVGRSRLLDEVDVYVVVSFSGNTDTRHDKAHREGELLQTLPAEYPVEGHRSVEDGDFLTRGGDHQRREDW